MKKIILFIGIFAGVFNSFAQDKDFIENRQNWDKQLMYWGYYIGVNSNSFRIDYQQSDKIKDFNNPIESSNSVGFNLGLIGDLRLHKNANLRLEPGLTSVSRTLRYNPKKIAGLKNTENDTIRKLNSTYLHIPILLKLSTDRYYNIRPYILGGIAYDYNFSSKERSSDDNSKGIFRMKRHNLSYELGVGIDIYLPYFVFSPSIRGVFGINSEMTRDKADNGSGYSPWTTPIKSLKSRGIFLKLAFH
ncbi:MAG: PorT family protein [Flavobacteriaceae bacterium]|nr:PorT family protein [Flavobacteriaceae bacterium]